MKEKMSLPASMKSPGTFEVSKPSFGGPSIVNVFPLPVCPYAKHVAFTPLKEEATSGFTTALYIY